jgi:hypothetical protein
MQFAMSSLLFEYFRVIALLLQTIWNITIAIMMDKFVQQYSRTPVLDGFTESQEDADRDLQCSSSSSIAMPHFELPKVANVSGSD